MAFDWLSGVTDALGIGAAVWNNERNIRTQKDENERNREFQSTENDKDRAWQEKLQSDMFNKQADFQRDMFDLQNEYNLPANQIARLMAAGINPAALMGSGGGLSPAAGNSQGFASSPQGGSLPSHSVSPTAGIQTSMYVPAMFSSLAQMQESISKSKLNDTERAAVEKKVGSEVDKLTAEADSLRADVDLKKAEANLTNINALLRAEFGANKEGAEITKLLNESFAAYAQGKLSEANELLTKANERIANIEGDIKDKTKNALIAQVGIYNNTLRSQSAANYASAEESRSNVQLNKVRGDLFSMQAKLTEQEWREKRATYQETLTKAVRECEQVGLVNDQIRESIEKLRTSNDYKDALSLVGILVGLTAAGKAVKAAMPVSQTVVKGFGQ